MASFKNFGIGWRFGLLSFYSSERYLLSTSVPYRYLTSVEQYHSVNICRKCQQLRKVSEVPSRAFFNVTNSDKKIEFSERKLVGYSMEQMYEIVADVKNYTEFIPFCRRSDILSRQTNHLKAKLEIGLPPILESYTCNVTLARPHFVKAEDTASKMFTHLTTVWRFSPGIKDNPHTCIVDFFISFEFKSFLHGKIMNTFFNELVRQMEGAFFTEAGRRYGKATIKSQKLNNVTTARS